ncbi:MAG: PhoX family phosphatase [Parvularculaceae bacterium]|nr:PhoX family phosphatase [Parvularculaceae bacterium]
MYDDPKTSPFADPNYEPECNASGNKPFAAVLDARYGRRSVLQGGVAAMALGFVGAAHARERANPVRLGFSAIPQSVADTVEVPAGYLQTPFAPWGEPIIAPYPDYLDGGFNTGADQEKQIGMHHDGMHYFPISGREGRDQRGLLVMNHEFIDTNFLHPNGSTIASGVRTVEDEVRKEIAAHGVTVVEIQKTGSQWSIVRGELNRRITGGTEMEITGPVRGSDLVKTRFSQDGTRARGTLNNCAHGFTPWNTYLTCEENWAGYFFSSDAVLPREQSRYGVPSAFGRYGWGTVDTNDAYARFNASTRGASALEDFRNEPNTFGWVVEIDPFDPTSTPKKRTALGRFAHEGAWVAPVRNNRPVTIYMGDDSRNEYVYKFVTRGLWRNGGDNRNLLEDGTLYVARFNDDGSGLWIDLVFGRNGLTPANGFASQADVLVNTRLAADFVGATPMDRPEWGAVEVETRFVYMTFTNNSRRTTPIASNPRAPNPFGHIIRWRERNLRYESVTFDWELFILAGDASDSRNFAAPGQPALDDTNSFSSPDGLWYNNGILWIQTDGNAFGNDQMLACTTGNGDIRRFFTGPVECEVTGVITTPDNRSMFVNVQHPGGNQLGVSNWPDGGATRPRSATVIIERLDGGVIGR